MRVINSFLDLICNHAAVINTDAEALKKDVEIIQKNYGKRVLVRGFSTCEDLFLAMRLAQAKKHPYTMAFIKEPEKSALDFILEKTIPNIKTYSYSDTTALNLLLEQSK